jgi:hypothetical protein
MVIMKKITKTQKEQSEKPAEIQTRYLPDKLLGHECFISMANGRKT